MAKKEEILEAMEFIHLNRPFHELDQLNFHEQGLGATIVYLAKSNTEVKSVDISNFLGISSARMAVILKKLESKHIINKFVSKQDSRAITIELTENGRILAQNIRHNMYETLSKIIDEIGLEAFYSTFETMNQIKKILHENKPSNMEVLHD